jgi:hypothetical protein
MPETDRTKETSLAKEMVALDALKAERESVIAGCKRDGTFSIHADLLDSMRKVIDYYEGILL